MEEAKRKLILEKSVRGMPYSQITKEVEVNRSAVYRAVERGTAPGTASGAARRSIRTPELVQQVEDAVESDPRCSIRQLARNYQVPQTSMRRLVREDLNVASLTRSPQPALTASARQNRAARAQNLLNRLKGPDSRKVIIFSDEKWFTLDPYVNRRNDRVICLRDPDDLPDEVRYAQVRQRA